MNLQVILMGQYNAGMLNTPPGHIELCAEAYPQLVPSPLFLPNSSLLSNGQANK